LYFDGINCFICSFNIVFSHRICYVEVNIPIIMIPFFYFLLPQHFTFGFNSLHPKIILHWNIYEFEQDNNWSLFPSNSFKEKKFLFLKVWKFENLFISSFILTGQ
jgi:hypothetical protein